MKNLKSNDIVEPHEQLHIIPYTHDHKTNVEIARMKKHKRRRTPLTVNHSCYDVINRKLSLKSISNFYQCSEATSMKLPKVNIRFGGAALLVYNQRRVKIVGVKSKWKTIFCIFVFRMLLGMMYDPKTECRLFHSLRFGDVREMNIVSMAVIEEKYGRYLDFINRKYSMYTAYVPELYPSLMLYHYHPYAKPRFTASMYDSGAMIFTGLKRDEDKVEALNIALYHVGMSIPDIETRKEFFVKYYGKDPPDITQRIKKDSVYTWLKEEKDREWSRFYNENTGSAKHSKFFSTSLMKHVKKKHLDRVERHQEHNGIHQNKFYFQCYLKQTLALLRKTGNSWDAMIHACANGKLEKRILHNIDLYYHSKLNNKTLPETVSNNQAVNTAVLATQEFGDNKQVQEPFNMDESCDAFENDGSELEEEYGEEEEETEQNDEDAFDEDLFFEEDDEDAMQFHDAERIREMIIDNK